MATLRWCVRVVKDIKEFSFKNIFCCCFCCNLFEWVLFYTAKCNSAYKRQMSTFSLVKIFTTSQFFLVWFSKFLSHTLVTFTCCFFDYVGYFLHQLKNVMICWYLVLNIFWKSRFSTELTIQLNGESICNKLFAFNFRISVCSLLSLTVSKD